MAPTLLPTVLTVAQAAKHVGVSSSSIRRAIARGELRVKSIGRVQRILEEDLAAWLRDQS